MPESTPTRAFKRTTPALVHPRLVGNLDRLGWFPMTVTIQERLDTNNRTAAGGWKTPAVWTDVSGLANVPCRRGVPEAVIRRAQKNEQSIEFGRIDVDQYILALNGFYPGIRTDMRAVVSDGLILDVRSSLTDSGDKLTTIVGTITLPGSEGRI